MPFRCCDFPVLLKPWLLRKLPVAGNCVLALDEDYVCTVLDELSNTAPSVHDRLLDALFIMSWPNGITIAQPRTSHPM
jgi:hypothetical protein